MKKVVHVISELDTGGAEKQLLLILPHLNKYYKNHVICLIGRGVIGDKIEKLGIPVTYIDGSSHKDIRIISKLNAHLKKLQPSLAIGYLLLADLTTRLVAKRLAIPYLSSQRSSHVTKPYLRIPDAITATFVHGFTTQTQHAANKLFTSGKQAHVIPNAVEIKESKPKNSSKEIIITCVASLKPGKGHETLLRAMQSAPKNITLMLAGTGKQEQRLKQLAKHLQIENRVQFLGLVADIPELLSRTDIFVLPTEGEGMSNAILEAMAAGLPIITTNIPANRALIEHNKTGVLIPTHNIAALTDTIAGLAADGALRNRLGAQARIYAKQQHSPGKIAQRWQQVMTMHAK